MHRAAFFSCALLLVLSLTNEAARADSYTGTWSITPSSRAGYVQLELRYHRTDGTSNEEWDESREIPAPHIRDGAFSLIEEEGEFRARGASDGAQAGGVWTFVPNPAFAQELQRRGLAAPSEKAQFQLAMGGFTVAELDALLAAGFARPSVGDLVRMQQHGVDRDYVNAMKNLRFSPKTVDGLIRLRDHGVTLAFIERMRSHGYTHLSADDLIRLRDHGF